MMKCKNCSPAELADAYGMLTSVLSDDIDAAVLPAEEAKILKSDEFWDNTSDGELDHLHILMETRKAEHGFAAGWDGELIGDFAEMRTIGFKAPTREEKIRAMKKFVSEIKIVGKGDA